MTTLEDMMNKLPEDRRQKIEDRASELVSEEMGRASVNISERMMTSAIVSEKGVAVIFDDDCKGVIPLEDIKGISGYSDITGVALFNPYEIILFITGDIKIELPWDFCRFYCDPSYMSWMEAIPKKHEN